MSKSPTVDSPDAAAILGQALYEFDSTTGKRGGAYYRAGKVMNLRYEDDRFFAEVAGGAIYEVEWERDGDTWYSQCTCPIGENCKHAFAVALAWLNWLSRRNTFRATGEPNAPGQPAAAATPPRRTFRQEWEPILAAKLGRNLKPEEGAFLGTLANIFHNFQHRPYLSGNEVRRLGFETIESRRGGFEPHYKDWWGQAPADPLALWQIFAYDIESSGLEVPEFMRPVTDTTAVRERVGSIQRRAFIQQWSQRFEQLARVSGLPQTQPDRRPATERLELRLRLAPQEWQVETRPTAETPWQPVPRGQLDRLTGASPGALANIETSPAGYAFLVLCQEYRRENYAFDLKPRGHYAPIILHRLLTHPLARQIVTGPTGDPVRISSQALTWQLGPVDESGDHALTLHLPDGAPVPPTAVHLPGRPDYYLDDGVVYPGPPPLDPRSTGAARVPAEVLNEPKVLQVLRQLGTRLPAEIESRFVSVPLRARIKCSLKGEKGYDEFLALEVLAFSDEPPVKSEWLYNTWDPTPVVRHKGTNAAAQKIHMFDLAAPNAAVRHLAELKVSYNSFQQSWTRRLTRTLPEEFLAWREQLPAEVEVLAEGELATLLGAPVRASVDFTLLESNVHRDWFDLALALRPEDTTLTPEEIALLLKARGKLVRIPGKGWRRLTVQLDDAASAALGSAGFDTDSIAEAALAGEKHRFHALQLAQSAVADLLPERQADALRRQARAITRPEPPAVPAGLRATLRPYQIEGFHFLAFLSANELGGILADDMGLGKTVQTLAWLLWLRGRQPAKQPFRALVVCPKSVVGNWETETTRFAPEIKTVRFTSAQVDAAPPAEPHIVLANYTQLRLGAEHFCRSRWQAVILDEGQFIKTPTAKVAQVARELASDHRVILTGTPIENRLLDLWSLFAFSLPGLLGSQAAFKRQYVQDNPLALPRLRTRVRHFLLRRTKAQVAADLPPRTEEDVLVDLEGEQRKLYDAELKRARAQLLKVETARQFDQARFNILASLMRLRQICCHPALIDAAQRETPSAKLDELLERVESLRDEGHQVLVFSQFVTMLELIRDKLTAAGIEHLMLTGQTENRDELVRTFQTDKTRTVFLLSLKAAGFGLNLTAASYVILYDPWWNPAVEAQAIDRTHRIGQSVPVNAYRLIARGTVEEKIRALQQEKAALASAIVQEESLAGVLDLDSLRQILS